MRHQSATSTHTGDTDDSMSDNTWVGVDLPKLVIGNGRGAGALRRQSNGFDSSYIKRIGLVRIISANARSFFTARSDWVASLGQTHPWRCASTTFCATPFTFPSFSWTAISNSSSSSEPFTYLPFQSVLEGQRRASSLNLRQRSRY